MSFGVGSLPLPVTLAAIVIPVAAIGRSRGPPGCTSCLGATGSDPSPSDRCCATAFAVASLELPGSAPSEERAELPWVLWLPAPNGRRAPAGRWL